MRSGITLRRLLAAALDVVIVILAYYAVLDFRYQGAVPESQQWGSYSLSVFLVAAVVIHIGLNVVFRIYSIVTRYVGLPQARMILLSIGASVALLLGLNLLWPTASGRLVPLSVVLAGGAATGVAMTVVRFYSRIFQSRSLRPVQGAKRILVIGAGQAAETLIRQIDNTPSLHFRIVGLLDDDRRLHRMRIHGYPVLGSIRDAAHIAKHKDVETFVIAIPSADSEQMRSIFEQLRPTGLPILTLPPLSHIIEGQVGVADVRELRVEDLLGRDPVEIDLTSIAAYLKGRRILVTGAAGSIGSELCRQVAAFEPTQLVLVDHDESGLYTLHEELRHRGFKSYSLVTSSVRRRAKMRMVFEEHRPQVVFHAAAFKHVPLMEQCPDEAVLNNILGTQVVAREAAAVGVERFVNISTDKAVDPVSVMGATKRVAEMVVHATGRGHLDTTFCSVRFGNVLASQGSVIPIFERQIANGGPVTVTHPDMTRYFMSIPEAVSLVLQAAAMSADVDVGPGVFVLEMGEPIRIMDIATKMIELRTDGGRSKIDIEIIGVRPGEKLHEVLVGGRETERPTTHPMIKLIRTDASASRSGTAEMGAGTVAADRWPTDLPPDFDEQLKELLLLAEQHKDREAIIKVLQALVPTYQPFSYEV